MPLTQLEDSITRVVEEVGPSVVTIATVQLAQDQFLRPFPVEGVGSGLVLSRDGLIVTNDHVVRRARSATVHFADGRKLEARYVGGDPESDVAVLRVDADDLVAARLADSDALRVGQLAIAIGSPFGFMLNGPTVTAGVVSALHRNLQGPQGVIEDLLQSDAPINPGNSGGPLLNSSGEVIGINTAIIPAAQGIGFAVPINRVRRVVDDVLAQGTARRPWLGVGGVTLTPGLARQHGVEPAQGVLVFQVDAESPADVSGIRPGDVLVALDGKPLSSVEQLKGAIMDAGPGARIRLEVWREEGSRELRATLRARPR